MPPYRFIGSNLSMHRCPAGLLEINWSDMSISAAAIAPKSGVVEYRKYTSPNKVFISASARLIHVSTALDRSHRAKVEK